MQIVKDLQVLQSVLTSPLYTLLRMRGVPGSKQKRNT